MSNKKLYKSSVNRMLCGVCGGIAKIPFKPVEGKSYYCSECFAKRKAAE